MKSALAQIENAGGSAGFRVIECAG
jgi:hypothetical protein